MNNKPTSYKVKLLVNGYFISKVRISRHYLIKHSKYMSDDLILKLVHLLDGGTYHADSTTDGIEYYVADVEYGDDKKVYRIIWLFEGKNLEILGVVNSYRRKQKMG